MPIQKRWSTLTTASPPDAYGIYEFGIETADGRPIIYIGRARQGDTTLLKRFKQHTQNARNGDPFIKTSIAAYGTEKVLYRFQEADAFTDPATMEANHLQAFKASHGQLPPGNHRIENIPDWWNRVRVVVKNWFD
jgi:hypothetical protein